MARIVQVGAGMCGLANATLLAKAGHEVTVLERDPMEPPADPEAAWAQWERKGVNQFRMLHYLQPRYRDICRTELPEFLDALTAAGCSAFNSLDALPAEVTGGRRPEDDMFTALTGRRPVVEAAVNRVAAATPGLTLRRGAAVAGLLHADGNGERPHVVGVRTDDGDEITGDLVVDAMGRRSPMPKWLADIGSQPLAEEEEDCGFVYYGRHFRSADGSFPPLQSGLLTSLGTLSVLILPADNGTWGVGLVTSANDKEMRALKNVDKWNALARSVPLIRPWVEAEPITDGVDVMARIPDRHRDLFVDGAPVVTGLALVADSWGATNPSVGRGITIGLIHAVALRDTLAATGVEDTMAFANAFHDATMATVEPWYRATLQFDQARLAEIHAGLAGEVYAPDDPTYPIVQAMTAGAGEDPDILRGLMSIAGMLKSPDQLFADAAFFEKVLGFAGREPTPPEVPDRAALVSLVA